MTHYLITRRSVGPALVLAPSQKTALRLHTCAHGKHCYYCERLARRLRLDGEAA